MSKVKKIVSCILAAVMILSASPLSFAYLQNSDGTDYVAGTDYVYSNKSYAANPTQITVDTSATTETVRIANSSNNCLDGTTIVKANSAGIAETSGLFANFAYGGSATDPDAAPFVPVVVMEIKGINDKTRINGEPTVVCEQMSGEIFSDPDVDEGTNSITYKWKVPVGNVIDGGNNTKLIYVITFSYNGTEYEAHAYATAKNVVRPNGTWVYYHSRSGFISYTNRQRASNVTQLYCAQSIPGFVDNSGTLNQRSYIQYNATVTSGDAISGMGKDDETSGTWLVKDNTNGNVIDARSVNNTAADSEKDGGRYFYGLDKNRCLTSVYIDLSQDHLGRGTSGTLTNGLNMRMVTKPGEYAGFYAAFFHSIALYTSNYNPGSGDCENTVVTSSVGNATTGTWTVDATGKASHTGSDDWSTTAIAAKGRKSDGTGGFVVDYDVSQQGNFICFYFGGTGAKTSGTIWSFTYQIQNLDAGDDDRTLANGDSGRRVKYEAMQSVQFMTYNTANLRTLIANIDSGAAGKGAFPQKDNYTGGWDAFETAYDNARGIIAKFDVNQDQINAAYTALENAYNGLTGYQEDGQIIVRHCLVNTTTELVPAQTFTKEGTWAQQGTSTTNIKNGASGTMYALVNDSNICNLKGYKVVGESSIKYSVAFSTSGTTIKNTANNTNIGSEIVFYYEPDAMNLKVGIGVWSDGQQYVKTFGVASGAQLNSSSSTVNFSTILADVKTQYASYIPAYTVYAGMYSNSSYSGSPIDSINGISGASSTWQMPPQETTVYMKWDAKPVKLKITTSYGVTETSTESVTPSMTPQTYEMGTVSFNEPAPPTQDGQTFVNFYTDATCETPITWPITADYYGNEAYAIEDSTDAYNYVNVYAKYVNLDNKIEFDTQGGTFEEGTTITVGSTQVDVVNNAADFSGATIPANISYPVPTKAGYTFTGWVMDLDSKTPVSGWTTTDTTSDTGVRAVEGGVHPQASAAGFVCYATWTANTITVTFDKNIPASETATMNSKNQDGQTYYYQTNVKADSPVDASTLPSTPRRYGFVFNYWSYNSRRFDTNGRWGTSDMTLVANWKQSNSTAFAELVSYVTVSGEDTIVDIQHDSSVSTTPVAHKGDVVKIQLEVGGSFYAGSSSWIFAYDADFFEQVTGVTAAANTGNSYISNIHADITEINGSTAANAYDRMMDKTGGKVIDPYTGAQIDNPGYIQVTVDPDVTQMTNGYKTVSFSDTTYMLEITLKIKSDTTKDTASFWLPTELVRSADNIMGDTYIAYSANEATLNNVQTDYVAFDAEPVSTIKVVPDPRPTTTITVQLPTVDGAVKGEFSDGTTTSKTYVGPAETEIESTFTTDNVTFTADGVGTNAGTNVVGFPEPTRTGYHIDSWTKVAGTGSAETWDSYSYANADQNGNTYEVVWAPNTYTLTFYGDAAHTSTLGTRTANYDQSEGINYVRYPSSPITEFLGWIPDGMEAKEENVVKFDGDYTVTGDASFYAWTKKAQKTVTISTYYNTEADGVTTRNDISGTLVLTADLQAALGIELRIDDTLRIVETAPDTTTPGVWYITREQLNTIIDSTSYNGVSYTNGINTTARSNYDVKASALPMEITITSGTNALEVEMEGAIVTVTFRSGTVTLDGATTGVVYAGTYDSEVLSSGAYEWKVKGQYDTAYDFAAASAGCVVPFGYKFKTFNPATNQGTYRNQTYTAQWQAASVTVHWIDENGADIKTATTTYNAAYNVKTNAPAAAKTGYTLTGWVLADPATLQAVNSTLVTTYNCSANPHTNVKQTGTGNDATYDIYFVPVYSANDYNVIYNTIYTDTGAATQYGTTEKVTFGNTYTVGSKPADPTGYTFDGWYRESSYAEKTTEVTSFTMGAEAVTLYGYYVPNSYDVYFYNNTSETDATYTAVPANYNAAITAPTSDPVRDGYVFKGWATTANATEADVVANYGTMTTTENGAVKFYAVWKADTRTYYVDYYFENLDGEYVKNSDMTLSYTGTVDQSYSVAESDKNRYATTTGYSYVAANNDETAKVLTADGELHLAVKYTLNTNTLYKNIDGTVTEVGTYKYGATVTLPEDPSKPGYDFAGWSGKENLGGNETDGYTMPDSDITVTATWNVLSYNVVYHIVDTRAVWADGTLGTAAESKSQSFAYGATIAKIADPENEGHDFKGWYTTADYTGEAYTFGTMPVDGVELYAKWEVKPYKISFSNTGDTAMEDIELNFGATVPAIADPVKAGYEFTGWSEAIPTTMPARNVTLVASWKVNEYTITFDSDGGTDVAPITQDYGTAITAPANPTKTGYKFDGWSPEVPATMPVGGATLTAQWKINQYTITFDTKGGSTVDPITQDYNTAVTAPEDPTKEGYEFDGWEPAVPTTMPAGDTTINAKWKVIEYKITYVLGNGEEKVVVPYDFGAEVATPATPTWAGHDFAGWSETVPATMPSHDIEITASWTTHEYTVEYVMNGGSPAIATATVSYGDTITLPVKGTDFARTGYDFVGWYTTNNFSGDALGTTYVIPAQSNNGATITLYANWSILENTINFVSNGGSAVAAITQNYNTAVSAPDAPTKPGYDFAGWYVNEDLSGTRYNFTTMPAESITLYAKWEEHNYPVVFMQPDGYVTDDLENTFIAEANIKFDAKEAYETKYVDYNAEIGTLPAGQPNLAYYDFLGWEDQDGNAVTNIWTMPAAEDGNYYITPKYSRTAMDLEAVNEGPDAPVIIDNDVPPVSGYIYNAGDKLKKADVEAQFTSTGYSEIKVVGSKGKICGTGSRVEVYDKATSELLETYYLIVFGDVDGDAVCRVNDHNITEKMVNAEGARTWLVDDSTANAAQLRACYELAADVNGDSTVNATDVEQMYLYSIGSMTYSYDTDENSSTYHKYVAENK